ncbi:MAG: histidine phosphatase family protein [Rhodoglobus sp.]
MPATLIHLVRHGEVHNPEGVLYGRIPGYHLSELGHRMADAAAASLVGHPVTRLSASPLQRAQESAAPWAARFGLAITTDERLIEPDNWFEGKIMREALKRPSGWVQLRNPWKPSWGEPYTSVRDRMLAVVADAWEQTESGEAVLVSHQMPIVMVARVVKDMRLPHDPRDRRCALSSITTLERRDGGFVEVNYQEPAQDLGVAAIDLGAV